MATLATEPWSGANGTAWPPGNWTILAGAAGATVDVQGGAGRLVSPTAAWSTATASAILTGMPATADTEVTFDMARSTTAQMWPAVWLRNASTTFGGGAYGIGFATGDGVWYVTNAAGTSLSGDQAFTYPAASTTPAAANFWHVRFRVQGTTLSAKVWTGTTEPTAWSWTSSTAATVGTPGRFSIQGSSGPNANQAIYFDNLTVTDGATATETHTSTGTGTARATATSGTAKRATRTGTATSRASSSSASTSSRASTGTATSRASSSSASTSSRASTGTATARATATAATSRPATPGTGRDLTISPGELHRHPLTITGTRGHPSTVHALTRHPLTPGPVRS